jgi:uncharacterized membrane protein (DUF485 family)
MRGAIPPLSQYVYMMRCLVKDRDNFTSTSSVVVVVVVVIIIIIIGYGLGERGGSLS